MNYTYLDFLDSLYKEYCGRNVNECDHYYGKGGNARSILLQTRYGDSIEFLLDICVANDVISYPLIDLSNKTHTGIFIFTPDGLKIASDRAAAENEPSIVTKFNNWTTNNPSSILIVALASVIIASASLIVGLLK